MRQGIGKLCLRQSPHGIDFAPELAAGRTKSQTRAGMGRCAMSEILEGVVQSGRPGGSVPSAAEIGALARDGRVAYRVLPTPQHRQSADKRASHRRRSRLRSAKLLDANNRFLCECLVHDRSSMGLRLKLLKNIGLPSRCVFFDDESGELRAVAIVWRRNAAVGMRYRPGESLKPLPSSARAALKGRYYAIAD